MGENSQEAVAPPPFFLFNRRTKFCGPTRWAPLISGPSPLTLKETRGMEFTDSELETAGGCYHVHHDIHMKMRTYTQPFHSLP